ncbi:hypothetical protein ALC53_12878 [Atta colombica]|uniref:Uncharacterized protein n=1 Tax=Atta colombica TaxID=520822 RepID=A0A151HZC2_9HYME|nr:hypothetical protein ALC53_12878 [Atta colombica]
MKMKGLSFASVMKHPSVSIPDSQFFTTKDEISNAKSPVPEY